jgi:hypothetical protein
VTDTLKESLHVSPAVFSIFFAVQASQLGGVMVSSQRQPAWAEPNQEMRLERSPFAAPLIGYHRPTHEHQNLQPEVACDIFHKRETAGFLPASTPPPLLRKPIPFPTPHG